PRCPPPCSPRCARRSMRSLDTRRPVTDTATQTRTRDGGPALSRPASRRSRGERRFRLAATASGILVLIIMAAVAVFLIVRAIPALHANTGNFLTEKTWTPNAGTPVFGIAAL